MIGRMPTPNPYEIFQAGFELLTGADKRGGFRASLAGTAPTLGGLMSSSSSRSNPRHQPWTRTAQPSVGSEGFAPALAQLAEVVPSEQVAEMIGVGDMDKDGRLSQHEFMRALEKSLTPAELARTTPPSTQPGVMSQRLSAAFRLTALPEARTHDLKGPPVACWHEINPTR
ncbi:hypothetical protein PAPYR_2688 [Paratrimastix pyriformis]|uniref:EF-hand domain-containing protein n=1 Tax=Paratrimastix pyriformis TaxID=342808 RepID=A0ABQ8UVS7_9EUKA|nr:hypothetical protein PAPYR_2688 [Paratrimastix pyriformis]